MINLVLNVSKHGSLDILLMTLLIKVNVSLNTKKLLHKVLSFHILKNLLKFYVSFKASSKLLCQL